MSTFRCLTAALSLCFATLQTQSAVAAAPPALCSGVNLLTKAEKETPASFQQLQKLAAATPNGEGLLWKIEKQGTPASYLFGTIHSTDPGAIAIARSLQPILANTKLVVTELGEVSSAVEGVKLGFRAMTSKVHSESFISSPEDRKRVDALLRTRNLNPAAALRMPPWLLMTLTSFPSCEIDRVKGGLPIVDKTVETLGKSAGAKIVGLETIDEQADALESVDPKLAVHMVELMARHPTLTDDAFATLTALYLAHRPGAILPLIEVTVSVSDEDKKANEAFMVTIVEKRNVTMLERSLPLLAKGDALIAVGALHLIGPKGLVALLRERGFTVTKVW